MQKTQGVHTAAPASMRQPNEFFRQLDATFLYSTLLVVGSLALCRRLVRAFGSGEKGFYVVG